MDGRRTMRISLLFLAVCGVRAFTSVVKPNSNVVVVGGGPVGLLTGLILCENHRCNVTILEQSKEESAVSKYDPTKAYLYNVNPRGLELLGQFPEVFDKLFERGVAPENGIGIIQYVPADPEEPLPELKGASPVPSVPPKMKRSVWIPRHRMVEILMEHVEQVKQRTVVAGSSGSATIETVSPMICVEQGKAFRSVSHVEDDRLLVTCEDGSAYAADLVVAADGAFSATRNFLTEEHDDWLHAKAEEFRIKQYQTPSTGLRIKVLQLKPDFSVPCGNGTNIESDPTHMYVFRGQNKGRFDRLQLGLLPTKDQKYPRPANIITPPSHEIWRIQTGQAAKSWFQKNFPRLDFSKMVDESEWDRFAKAEGTRFPLCQYSPANVIVSPSRNSGIVMVGDACHAFPPDIGQGINAGIQDVLALDRCLKGQDIAKGDEETNVKKPKTLGDALEDYERNRVPEHKALIRLARFGAPYQYRQPLLRDRVGRTLYTWNVLCRFLLHKLSVGILPKPAVLMAQDASLSFRQVMRQADTVTLGIKAVALTILCLVLKSRFPKLL